MFLRLCTLAPSTVICPFDDSLIAVSFEAFDSFANLQESKTICGAEFFTLVFKYLCFSSGMEVEQDGSTVFRPFNVKFSLCGKVTCIKHGCFPGSL